MRGDIANWQGGRGTPYAEEHGMRTSSVFGLCGFVLALTLPGKAVSYTFTKIADTGDGLFLSIETRATINRAGTVAFRAKANGTGRMGVYRGNGGLPP
jgi:hypothetical protein